MQPIQVSVAAGMVTVESAPAVTAGTVGLPVAFHFDEAWQSLQKTAVFRANGKILDCLMTDNTAVVPWELLLAPKCRLYVGVYGTDGERQIPTLWAEIGEIQPGAEPAGDESAAPTLPVWRQLTEEVEAALEEIIRLQNRLLGDEGEAGESL